MTQADWPRYVFASVADYCKSVAASIGLPIVIDHCDDRTEAVMAATDRAEVRITGPSAVELSKNYYRLFVDVSILLVSRYDGQAKNVYDSLRWVGEFYEALTASVPVWNFGNQPGDYLDDVLDELGQIVVDNSSTRVQLGCLVLRPGQSIQVINHGQVDQVQKIKMSEVNGRFVMDIQL